LSDKGDYVNFHALQLPLSARGAPRCAGHGSGSAGGPPGSGGAGGNPGASNRNSGCSCTTSGGGELPSGAFLLLLALLVVSSRRGRRGRPADVRRTT